MKKLWLLLMPALLIAAGVVTNETDTSTIDKIVFQWTNNASGTTTGVTANRYTGAIGRVIFDPGSTAPSDNYDLVINDQNSYDILNGRGANLDSVTTTQVDSIFGAIANSKLTIVVTNAGNAKTGTVVVYIVPSTDCDNGVSTVSDTTGLYELGKLYFYTGDSTLYIGNGTDLTKVDNL